MAMRAAIRGKSVPQIQAIPMAQLKRPVTKADFEMAIAKCRKTVTAADIRQFEEWNEKFGSSV
ncbi:katanin p60 ATPase-containing subunit A-like 1 [Diaphorina citri]|uniref:Katanin p60 ATPase-containing subunit A-like 1 n=1 Tax=Diaphorina citri TaxID=121845 RepID=A0A3Q0IYA0_DIACI|nr:katanin p60 ATPase-containing subunit A-like 1 [Diaphorina citri]